MGNAISETDISMELVKVAKEVHLSAKSLDSIYERLPKFSSKHDHMHLNPQVYLSIYLYTHIHSYLYELLFSCNQKSHVEAFMYFDVGKIHATS